MLDEWFCIDYGFMKAKVKVFELFLSLCLCFGF